MANGNEDKTLKALKKEFDKKIAKAEYANSIKAECYFNISSTKDYDNRQENSILSLSKDKPPIQCTINRKYLSATDYAFSTGIKNIYPKLIEETSKIKVNNKIYATTINETLGKILGKEISIDDNNKEYITSISYKEESEILQILKAFKSKLESINTENIKTRIINNIESPHTQVSVDQEGYWDGLGAIASSRGEYYQLCDKTQKQKYLGFFKGSTVIYPTIKGFLKYLQNYRTDFSVYDENKFINKELKYVLDTLLDQINSKVKEAIDEIGKIQSKIEKICEEYKKLEKKEKRKYKSNLEKAIISQNDKKANKAIKELRKLGLSKKKIKSLIASYSKAASVTVSYKKTKSLAIKTLKKNAPKKPQEPQGHGGSGGGTLAATGATVAKTKKNKTKSKGKDKTKNKTKTKKGKNLAVASAATIASYEKTMQKKADTIDKIKVGTVNKIEQAKLDLTTRISQINSDRDANITNIEAERDRNIADLYEQASNEINSIDPTDTDAKEQIASIKSDLENNINQANEDANAQIEEVKANAEQQIAEANEESATAIENIQKESDKEINNITTNGLQEETTTGQDLETAADTPPTAKDVDQTNINDANSNKETSTKSLEESRTAYNNDVSAKEQEINNPSNNQETQPPVTEESSSSNNEEMVYQQESNNSGSSESSNYSNYSSNESNNSSTASSDPADIYVEDPESEIVETPAVPEEELGSETTIIPDNPNNEELNEVDPEVGSSANSEIIDVPKKENKSNVAIPIGLGVAAAGAAAVAGVRFVKNRKQNDESEESYDDENNNLDDYESGSDDSEYMKDDYLGPSGSMYTDTDFEDDELSEVPDDTKYNDAAHLEEQIEDDSDAFTEDEILNDLG